MRRTALTLLLAAALTTGAWAEASSSEPSLSSVDNAGPLPAPKGPPAMHGPPGDATAVAVRSDANQIVCHYTQIVGSRLVSLLCLSKRRWARMHKDGQTFMGENF